MFEATIIAAYVVTHAVALYLLVSSGAFADLFGWFHPRSADEIDLLSEAPAAIDDHEFWSLSDDPADEDFWGGALPPEPAAAGTAAATGTSARGVDHRSAAEVTAEHLVAEDTRSRPALGGEAVDF